MSPDQVFDRYILKLKVGGLKNCGLYGNLLLHELFVHFEEVGASELVQGYITVGGESCWHVWVEVGERRFDVISQFATGGAAGFDYFLDRPSDDTESDEDVTAQYELYVKDRHEFWKSRTVPQKVKNFRAKIMRALF